MQIIDYYKRWTSSRKERNLFAEVSASIDIDIYNNNVYILHDGDVIEKIDDKTTALDIVNKVNTLINLIYENHRQKD